VSTCARPGSPRSKAAAASRSRASSRSVICPAARRDQRTESGTRSATRSTRPGTRARASRRHPRRPKRRLCAGAAYVIIEPEQLDAVRLALRLGRKRRAWDGVAIRVGDHLSTRLAAL
jgi:hypothetical protein